MKLQLGKLEIEVKEFLFKLYDKRGNNGYRLYIYDKDGRLTYFRNAYGVEIGTPPSKSCEGKMVEIDGKKYQLKEVK